MLNFDENADNKYMTINKKTKKSLNMNINKRKKQNNEKEKHWKKICKYDTKRLNYSIIQ